MVFSVPEMSLPTSVDKNFCRATVSTIFSQSDKASVAVLLGSYSEFKNNSRRS